MAAFCGRWVWGHDRKRPDCSGSQSDRTLFAAVYLSASFINI